MENSQIEKEALIPDRSVENENEVSVPAEMYLFPETDKKEWKHIYDRYVNSNEILAGKIPIIVKRGMSDKDVVIRVNTVSLILLLSGEEQIDCIKQGLSDEHWLVQGITQKLIFLLPEDQKEKLIKLGLHNDQNDKPPFSSHKRDDLADLLLKYSEMDLKKLEKEENINSVIPVDNELYQKTGTNFRSKKFDKTGSETTLLGNQLSDKVIIRHIPLSAYLSWRRAFEDYTFWQKQGFDYVPIEPILDVAYKDKDSNVDVATQVLGPNISMWLNKNNHFKTYIEEQKTKIDYALNELGIVHCHLHNQNFCLVFEKQDNGEPDYNKHPRVYAIDFDQAIQSTYKNPIPEYRDKV